MNGTACTYPSLEFADDALASHDGVRLDFLQSHGQVLHLDLEGLLDGLDLDDALLLLVEDLHGVLELVLHSLVSLVAHSQLLGHLLVVTSQGSQLLLDLRFRRGEVHVDGGQLVDAANSFLVCLLDGSLRTEGLVTHTAHMYLAVSQTNTSINSRYIEYGRTRTRFDTHRFVVAAYFLELGRQRLEASLTDAQLVQGHLQLALDLVVVSLKLLKIMRVRLR